MSLINVMLKTSCLITNTMSVTEGFGISSFMVKTTVIKIKASVPRLIIDFVKTMRNGPSMTVKGIIKSGVFGILNVLKLATIFFPVTIGGRGVGFRLPMYVNMSLLLATLMFGLFGKDIPAVKELSK